LGTGGRDEKPQPSFPFSSERAKDLFFGRPKTYPYIFERERECLEGKESLRSSLTWRRIKLRERSVRDSLFEWLMTEKIYTILATDRGREKGKSKEETTILS